jgi:SNF2 family DNA or RNA helicase
LGSTFEEFRRVYCTPEGGYVQLDALRDRLASISLRRLKDQTLALPPKSVIPVTVRLVGRQAQLYDQMRRDLYLWVKGMSGEAVLANAENVLVRLLRLAQLASDPRLLDASYAETPAKIAALDRLLEGLLDRRPPQKVIVWSSFVGNIRTLAKRYRQHHPVTFFGEMRADERERSIAAFTDDPSVRLFIGNPAAGREGLTLTCANAAVYLDRTFNLVDYVQSQDRIHRISQVQPCEIYILLAERTVDELIEFTLAQKLRLAQYVQRDAGDIEEEDAALQKPDILRALAAPPKS